MASNKQRGPDDKGKMRVRIIDFELEGSNDALLEGIRQISSAATPRAPAVVRTTTRVLSTGNGAAAEPADTAETGEVEEEQVEGEEPAAAAAKAKSRGPKPAPKTPDVIDALNVEGNPMPLKEFVETTRISKDSSMGDRVIVCTMWMKEHRPTFEMGAAEFYTCCRFMKWDSPSDHTEPMRKLKASRHLTKGSKAGKFVLTTLGESHFKSLLKT